MTSVQIASVPVKALYDTGSSVTILHKSALDKLRRVPSPDKPGVSVTGVTGSPLHLYGRYLLPVTILNRTYVHSVLISTDNLSPQYDLILGADFIHQHKLAYDPTTRQPFFTTPQQDVAPPPRRAQSPKSVRFQSNHSASLITASRHEQQPVPPPDKKTPQKRAPQKTRRPPGKTDELPGQPEPTLLQDDTQKSSDHWHSAFVQKTTAIPAKSELVLYATVSHTLAKETAEKDLLIAPHPHRRHADQLLVAKSLNKVHGSRPQRVLVRVFNTSDTTLTLPKHASIAAVLPVPDTATISDPLPDDDPANELGPAPSDPVSSKENSITPDDFDLTGVPPAHKERLLALLMKYKSVFGKDVTDIKGTKVYEHNIEMNDQKPVNQRPYPVPFAHRETLKTQIKQLADSGIIEPSISPYNSPVIMVQKDPKSKPRFVLDLRQVNAKAKVDSYPAPILQDVLDQLSGMSLFSTLDLLRSYHQIPLSPSSRPIVAFTADSQKWQYKVCPFGLQSSSSALNRALQIALSGLHGDSLLVYVDDVIVSSTDVDSHFTKLERVLRRLQHHRFILRPAKCEFLQSTIKYLGFQVSADGVTPDPEKIDAVKNYPRPQNAKQVKQFLGFANFYRRFIPNMAEISLPLNNLTRDSVPFLWSATCEQAFSAIKEALISYPILQLPKFDREFHLSTDASKYALGAVLEQISDSGDLLPIAYLSRNLNKAEINYSVTEKEALAIVWAFSRFHTYLLGQPVIVHTDHLPLTTLFKTSSPGGKLTRWCLKLSQYNFTMHYVKGRLNGKPDTLSRIPIVEQTSSKFLTGINAIDSAPPDVWDRTKIRKAQEEDVQIRSIIEQLKGNPSSDYKLPKGHHSLDEFFLSSDHILYHVTRNPSRTSRPLTEELVVPPPMRPYVLHSAHNASFSAHMGVSHTFDKIRKQFFWFGMYGDIRKYVMSCKPCFERKSHRYSEHPPLQRFTKFTAPFDFVSMDIIGPFTTTYNGNRYILSCLDEFTKWPELFAIPDQTADTISKIFVKEIICRYGTPNTLLTDQGRNFTSKLLQQICNNLKIKKIQTTAFHPQSNSRIERQNQPISSMLSHLIDPTAKDWDEQLPFVLLSLRTRVHTTLRETPGFLLFGRDLRIPQCSDMEADRIEYASLDSYKTEMIQRFKKAYELVDTYTTKAAMKQEEYYDRDAKASTLKTGDLVYLYVPSTPPGISQKLLRKNKGPYRIITLPSPVNAKIQHIHNASDVQNVHISRLRRYIDYRPTGTIENENQREDQENRNNTERPQPSRPAPSDNIEQQASHTSEGHNSPHPPNSQSPTALEYHEMFSPRPRIGQMAQPPPQPYNLRPRQALQNPARYRP